MFNRSCRGSRHTHNSHGREAYRDMARAFRPSGNTAFDAYKADTIRRLTDEQEAFEAFLQRLRDAKDKQEFDSFMDDRARTVQTAPVPADEPRDDPRAAGY